MKYVCSNCGTMVAVSTRLVKCDCGVLWKLDYKPPKFDLSLVDRETWSIFRYRAFMPLEGEYWREISLGEGMTPFVTFDEDVLFKGIYCEHTTAANYVAYLKYCKVYGKTSDCLIPMCGAGLKSDH